MEDESTTSVFERENRDLCDFITHFDDDDDDDANDDTEATTRLERPRALRLDAARGKSIDVVEEIRRMPLPREDGYTDTLEERRDARRRPFNREYLKEQLDRMMALEENPYYQFVQLLAGGCDRGVLDLMDHQDLERVLHERQLRDRAARLEQERSIVSLRDKEAALMNARTRRIALNSNLRRLRQTTDLRQLAERGQLLVEQLLLPVLVAYAQLNHTDEEVTEPEPRDDTQRAVKKALTDIVAGAASRQTMQDLLVRGRQRRLLSDLVLSGESERARKRLADGVASGDIDAMPAASSTTKLASVPLADGKEVARIFGVENMAMMLRQACQDEYGAWKSQTTPRSYTDWAMSYLTTNDAAMRRELRLEFNLFTSGGPDGQPPAVASLIAQQTGGRTDAYGEHEARVTLGSHLMWLYMHNRSLRGLALDAYNQDDAHNEALHGELNREQSALRHSLEEAEPLVAAYFSAVLQFLARGQPLRLDNDDQRALVRLPHPLARLHQKATLDELNQAMQRAPDYAKWIEDAAFELYFLTGKTEYARAPGEEGEPRVDEEALQKPAEWLTHDVPRLVRQDYPVLALYSLLRGYAEYAHVYAGHVERRLARANETVETLERQIEQIARESNSLEGEPRRAQYVQTRGFVSLPQNSGIIKLASFVVTALDKAYRVVRQYCPELRGLRDADFYCREAHRAGLAGDFARFVAALIAELRLVHVSQYNTQHQQNSTLMATDDAERALRRYSVRHSWVTPDGFELRTPEDDGARSGRLAALNMIVF